MRQSCPHRPRSFRLRRRLKSAPPVVAAVAALLLLGTVVTGAAWGQSVTDASAADAGSAVEAPQAQPAATPAPDAGDAVAAAAAPSLPESLAKLADRSFKVKQQAAEDIAASGDPRAVAFLRALLDGDLYYRKDDDRIVFAERSDGGWALTDALTGEDLGEVGRRDARKITINNRMRSALRTDIAALTLASPDAAVRLEAALEMVGTTDPDTLAALEAQRPKEQDAEVLDAIELALAIAGLEAESPDARMEAVAALGASLYPEARNALDELIRVEQDTAVLAAAEAARADTERRVENMRRLETLFFGLSLGSVLVLAAIGLAITFGVMGVINMAHGELIMLGAYTTYLVQLAMPNAIDYSVFVAIPAAFVVAGLFGVAIERGVIRFLYGRPLETLLATFGISLILQQLVRTTISAQNVIVENPSWMSGSLQLNPALSLTFNRVYIFVFALLVFVALLLVLKRTALGLQVRAVSQNRAMARAMGVRSGRVDALTFGLGAGIAGVAGVALSQLTNVGPNMGQAYIIDSFMVVVFGGVGNLWGTLVGGLTLGVANKFMEPWTGAVLAKILVLVFIILFIQWRPRGLFPQRGRAAEG
ncbi:MAG: urea ABC transporter permease subunit UrtB [Gammaproteobacteria bacterium]|nr:urea ABC transporter permease subunit UrtB [Gammaproteobacteria bacterium]